MFGSCKKTYVDNFIRATEYGNIAFTTILDIKSADFLQFQRDFIPQAELEEAFIYIIHRSIYFFHNTINIDTS